MDIRHAFKEQYHASLAMLDNCVEVCPDEVWTSGEQPRKFWQIAFHAAFFGHLYLGQNLEAYRTWPGHRGDRRELWENLIEVEPYEFPQPVEPCERSEIREYIAYVDSLVDPTVDALDLDSAETGFPWYKHMSKLSHELLSLRHIQGHVGQLSEILMAQGIDTKWIGKAAEKRG